MIYIIRHAESESNLKGIYGGNEPLTDLGRIQASCLGSEFIDNEVGCVISSNRIRAKETAMIVFPDYPVNEDEAFNEIHFGDLEGKEIGDTWNHFVNSWEDIYFKHRGDNFYRRVFSALSSLRTYSNNIRGDKFIFSHGIIMELIEWYLSYKSLENYKLFEKNPKYGNCKYFSFNESILQDVMK